MPDAGSGRKVSTASRNRTGGDSTEWAVKWSVCFSRLLNRLRERSNSNLQIEEQDPFVLEYSAEFFAKMPVKFPILLCPPECRPGEGNIPGTVAAQPLQFADCSRVVRRWPPVCAVLFQERNCALMRQVTPNLLLIHQNKWFGQRDELQQCIPALLQSPQVGLGQGFRGSAYGHGHARLHKNRKQRSPVDDLHCGAVKPPEIDCGP